MATNRECQRCGNPIPELAPDGECPVCLIQITLDSGSSAHRRGEAPPASPEELQPHFPHLEIVALLGRGGMGTVYKALQVELNRPVAVKLLEPGRAADPVFAERFLREARTLARLHHPHIVAVHEVGRAAGTVYIVMEFVEGANLRDCLREGRLSPAETLRMIPQLCDAIQYAHDAGVVHRDIKPENILIDGAGNVRIADFGLAKLGDRDFDLTEANERLGTPRYMAPEQWANTSAVDHRADIYSLGVMFYEMLTGDLPGPQSKPASAKADTDPRLDGVIARSLRENPAERYQKAAEIKTAVQRIACTRPWTCYALPALGIVSLAGLALLVWLGFGRRPAEGSLSPGEILVSDNWEWTPPENLGEGVNSQFDEGIPAISADGLTLIFHSNRPGGEGGIDLWESRRKSPDEPFENPVNLGKTVNGPGDDMDPCLSADGLTLAFVSVRQGGQGKTDILISRRSAADAPWQTPENLGPKINSPYAEYRPWLSADGLSLTFSSMRPPSNGVWICRRSSQSEPFGEPAPFGKQSSRIFVSAPSFSADGRTILCNRADSHFPGDLLWLGPIETPEQPFRSIKSFGPAVNSPYVDIAPAPSADGRTVYFQSNRPGGFGGHDIWMTKRVRK